MNDAGIVTFGIPLMGKAVAGDWARVVRQLEATIGSIYAQTDAHFRIIVAGTDPPPLAVRTDERCEFIAVPQLPQMGRWAGVMDGVRKRHRVAERLRELGGGYLMLTDADDLISTRLVEFVRRDRHPNGYLVGQGYMFDAGRGLLAPFPFPGAPPEQRFDQECGTSAMLFLTPEELPPDERVGDNRYDRLMAAGHPFVIDRAAAEGRPLQDLPERMVCYVRNTGENISTHGASGGELERLPFQAWLDDQVAAHALPRTAELDAEFNLAAAEAVARTSPTARRYRPTVGLSVLIATYRRPNGLRRLLSALRPQVEGKTDREIVVVNDGSHDPEYAKVAAEFGDIVRYRDLGENKGVAAARNAGLALARGSYAVFTDDDCVPPPWWLDWLSARLHVHPELDVVAGTTRPRYVTRGFGERVQGLWFIPRPWRIGDRVMFVTANVAIRTALLRRVGGFGEFGGAGEDTEASLRLHRDGARFAVDPAWTVAHDVDLRFRSLARKYRRYGAANAAIAKATGVEMPPPGGIATISKRPPGFAALLRAQRTAAAGLNGGLVARALGALAATAIYWGYERSFRRARS
jgi:GT2 family glycosyltransferase